MRKWAAAVAALAIVAFAGVFAMRMLSPPPADLDLVRQKTSSSGLYRVAIEPEAAPLQQGTLHGWLVSIETPDGEPVTDAEIAVDGGMPQHGHGLPTAPQSAGHIGEGRYRIEGVRFNMGGWWVIRFAISSPAGDDWVEFNIMV